MLMTEAVNEVLSITKRPDKRVEIISNINKAMSFFTMKADFSRDMLELSVPIAANSYGESIDLTDPLLGFVRFRKIKFVKPRSQRYYLTQIDPTDVFTPGGTVQTNRFYVAGQSLTYTLSICDSFLEVGYYQYAPILSETTGADAHWMLDLIPWAITERAAAQIFKSIGDDTSARFYENSSMEMFLTARRDFADQVANDAT